MLHLHYSTYKYITLLRTMRPKYDRHRT